MTSEALEKRKLALKEAQDALKAEEAKEAERDAVVKAMDKDTRELVTDAIKDSKEAYATYKTKRDFMAEMVKDAIEELKGKGIDEEKIMLAFEDSEVKQAIKGITKAKTTGEGNGGKRGETWSGIKAALEGAGDKGLKTSEIVEATGLRDSQVRSSLDRYKNRVEPAEVGNKDGYWYLI